MTMNENMTRKSKVFAKYAERNEKEIAALREQLAALTARAETAERLLRFAVVNEDRFTEWDRDGIKEAWIDKARCALNPKPKP
jgi:hypothetical protein